ncbi:serine hydrolase domain-containing protein [Frondihabitans australicus]|uniref:CubicO group peptidase (Beta-lactamase class C family) n=1 Tax=Frondihabitans australicus TaxID=386892 RepID=A0A495IAK3_9MICO|nr:serine hydrolase domain-containing protein [Frondihabitans australicus]RKR73037.1 CubicO group peptidase (beta-lactamase class C family) [Frondihabitans australicus]
MTTSSITIPGPALDAVERLFADRASPEHAPSSSWGVFTRTGLVRTGSTGVIVEEGDTQGVPPTSATVYRIASCTKSFTATALLALRDEGALNLDQPITDFVPAFAEVRLPTLDSPVPTVRMLLTMSGGFPTDDPWGDRQESITDGELDALLRRGLSFDSVPGTRFAYSNLGYALLGRVVAEAAGRPFRDVVTDRILRPLGLASTTFTVPGGLAHTAIGHRRRGGVWEPLAFSGPGLFSSIGGLFSTVDDLSRWARWLASAFDQGDGDAPGDHPGILSRASRREMQQAYRDIPGRANPIGYGFGVMVEHDPELGPIVSHSGGYPGFSAHMRWHPASGVGVVGFENATYAQVSVPVTTALHGLLREVGAAPATTIWPETAAARTVVEQAVTAGAEIPPSLLSENVDLDIPFPSRRAAWAEAIGSIGPLVKPPAHDDTSLVVASAAGEESSAPSHLVWRLPGERGSLRIEIRLTPESPPRVQTLVVRAEPPRQP